MPVPEDFIPTEEVLYEVAGGVDEESIIEYEEQALLEVFRELKKDHRCDSKLEILHEVDSYDFLKVLGLCLKNKIREDLYEQSLNMPDDETNEQLRHWDMIERMNDLHHQRNI